MRFSGLTHSITAAACAGALGIAMVTAGWAQYPSHGRSGYHGGYAPHSQWHGGGYYRGGGYHNNSGAIAGGALLGLGLGALLGGALAAPPPVVYAPPPYVYRPAPNYPYPYAVPPPVYYGN